MKTPHSLSSSMAAAVILTTLAVLVALTLPAVDGTRQAATGSVTSAGRSWLATAFPLGQASVVKQPVLGD